MQVLYIVQQRGQFHRDLVKNSMVKHSTSLI